jgi:hypothetical protein
MCTGYRLGSAGVVPSRRAVSVSCLVVALLLSGAAVTAADEGTGEVTGTVSTEGGHALADADVRLVNMSTGNEETTTSDANGSYSFETVEPGDYRVKAEFGGSDDIEDITVEEDETQEVELKLRPEGAYFVVSVDSTNSPVTAGNDVRVEFIVTNAGQESGTQVVKLGTPNAGGEFEEAERVSNLVPGSSRTVSLNMSTGLGDAGNYTAEVVTDEDTDEVEFVVEGADVELSITDTNSPVAEGENLTVDTEVSSGFGVSGRETVAVNVSGLGSETKTFSLEGGDEKDERFNIPTEDGDAGEYTANLTFGERVVDSTDVTVEESTGEDTGESGSETNESEEAGGSDDESTENSGSEGEGNGTTTGDSNTDNETVSDEPGGGDGDTQGVFGLSLNEALSYLGMALAAVVGIAVLAASSVLVARRLRGRNRGGDGSDRGNGHETVFDTEYENDVYVSWSGMIDRAGIEDIGTKTPSEIAESAKEAGLDPGAVDELTDVFEEVRYRDTEPTAEQERRAKEAFERIKRSDSEG